jgi:hypothetical protein
VTEEPRLDVLVRERCLEERIVEQVDLGCEPPIQAQLFLASTAAQLERREVDEAEIDRLLHFVYIFSGQEHPGDMRLDQAHARYRMRIACGIKKGRESRAVRALACIFAARALLLLDMHQSPHAGTA